MTIQEHGVLADMEYKLGLAFMSYKDNKRLTLKQKGALEQTFTTLKKLFETFNKDLFSNPAMRKEYCDYFEKKYGVKL